MSQRWTRADAERQFAYIAALCDMSDRWALDYAAPYGGFVITERTLGGSGLSHPFGDQRRSATDFVEWTFILAKGIGRGSRMSHAQYRERQHQFYSKR